MINAWKQAFIFFFKKKEKSKRHFIDEYSHDDLIFTFSHDNYYKKQRLHYFDRGL